MTAAAPNVGTPSQTHLRVFLLVALALAAVLRPLAAAERKPLDQYFQETWTTREGLPHNSVNAITQTADGYLWIGTWEGVSRYSGHGFRTFDRRLIPELPDSGIHGLYVEADGSLLIAGARGGMSRYRDGVWSPLPQAPTLINRLLRDRNGSLWAGMSNGGLMQIDPEGRRQYFAVDPDSGGGRVHALLEDRLGRIWVGSSHGLKRIVDDQLVPAPDRSGRLGSARVLSLLTDAGGHLLAGTERGLYVSVQPLAAAADPDLSFVAREPELATDAIASLLIDRRGDLWMGTINQGLFRRSPLGLEQLDTRAGLPNSRVLDLFEDREGSLWIGTNGGLLRLGDAPFSSVSLRNGLSDDFVRSLLELPDGRLLVGTSRGLNIVSADGSAQVWDSADSLDQLSVLSLAPAARGGFWVGTYAEGVMRVEHGRVVEQIGIDQGLPSNEVRALLEDRDGSLWMGTTQGLAHLREGRVAAINVTDGLPDNFIVSLLHDSTGALWVGTGKGLVRLHAGRMETISLAAAAGAESVYSMREDRDAGVLWLATDRGLLRLRLSDRQMGILGHANGLPFEKFFSSTDDGAGGLWLAGNAGVLRIDREQAHRVASGQSSQLSYEQFAEADGMLSAQCNGGSWPSALLRADGSIWVATALGAAHIDPSRLEDFAQRTPPVVIESVQADGSELALTPTILIPAGTSRIEIAFAGLAFVMPQRVRYRYRLEGFDRDWIERGAQGTAAFTNLGPGNYVLHVQAAHTSGQWNPQAARLSLQIAPLWWQRWSTRAAFGLLLSLLIFSMVQHRLRRLRQREARLLELVEERTRALSTQTERLIAADSEKSCLLEQLQRQSEAFARQAREDPLTGLANRRALDELLAYEFARAERSDQPLCVALVDIDHFKRVNDEHSHAVGDAVLKTMAERMRELCRDIDTVARWGGEEFAVLLPNTRLSDALSVCERMRAGIDKLDFDTAVPGLHITISIGLASHEGHVDYDRMLSQADAALYAAKSSGRNRVAC
ncbi:two-component regulator propeller domain-containing protein [Aquimonas sp.]|uniref:two-component regulator propeller domain-containing protein n=1 Tax=Aquimonas sp. TaxID=1872588 RepID=UPI0037BF5A73